MNIKKIVIATGAITAIGFALYSQLSSTADEGAAPPPKSLPTVRAPEADKVVAPVSQPRPDVRTVAAPPSELPKPPLPAEKPKLSTYERERGKQVVPPPPRQPGHSRDSRFDKQQADYHHGHDHSHDHTQRPDLPAPPTGANNK